MTLCKENRGNCIVFYPVCTELKTLPRRSHFLFPEKSIFCRTFQLLGVCPKCTSVKQRVQCHLHWHRSNALASVNARLSPVTGQTFTDTSLVNAICRQQMNMQSHLILHFLNFEMSRATLLSIIIH